MPRQLRQTKPSTKDIDEIWDYTSRTHSVEQADEYLRLLDQAFRDIEREPERPSSRPRLDLGNRIRSYHIALSKERSGTGVKSPRHVVIYRVQDDDLIVVLRVLHDAMEPGYHLSDE